MDPQSLASTIASQAGSISGIVPAYQPLPFPAPFWLLELLLILGFFLHALPMNVVLGGGFISSILIFLGRNNKESLQYRSGKALAVSLPLFVSFAITQGIVPLLFVQLLYGPAFYTSSILMATPWLAIVLILLVSYYLSYLTVYKWLKAEINAATAVKASLTLLIMALGFTAVGFLFANNMTLMLSPEKWLALYKASPYGMSLNTSEPQLISRYLHVFVASFATAGMTLGCFGLYIKRRNQEFADYMIKLGSRIFLVATVLQFPIGFWFLKSIPVEMQHKFMGGDLFCAGVFMASMALTLVALVASAMSSGSAGKKSFLVALISNALIILLMIVNRHQLRLHYLNPHLQPATLPVNTQWDLLIPFVLGAVALIAYLVWLAKISLKAYHPQAQVDSGSETA
jgi:hypothetical protein